MTESPIPSSSEAKSQPTLAALISGSEASGDVVRTAETLARALGLAWEAIFVETPETDLGGSAGSHASDALDYAARHGGTVATVAAATIADGICEHLQTSPAAHLVMETQPARRWRDRLRKSAAEELSARNSDLLLHIIPVAPNKGRPAPSAGMSAGTPATHYAIAAASTGAILLIAKLLHLFIPARSLDLLFLLPVIGIAARFGLRPALVGAVLSVLAYNFFLLAPTFRFDPAAPQNLVMVLFGVATYVSIVTGQVRGRLTPRLLGKTLSRLACCAHYCSQAIGAKKVRRCAAAGYMPSAATSPFPIRRAAHRSGRSDPPPFVGSKTRQR